MYLPDSICLDISALNLHAFGKAKDLGCFVCGIAYVVGHLKDNELLLFNKHKLFSVDNVIT